MIKEVDVDGDGRIDFYGEFLVEVSTNQKKTRTLACLLCAYCFDRRAFAR